MFSLTALQSEYWQCPNSRPGEGFEHDGQRLQQSAAIDPAAVESANRAHSCTFRLLRPIYLVGSPVQCTPQEYATFMVFVGHHRSVGILHYRYGLDSVTWRSCRLPLSPWSVRSWLFPWMRLPDINVSPVQSARSAKYQLIISRYYKRLELQLRINVFFCASILAGAFSGLLAYAIAHMDGSAGYGGWRWIFIIEGE